ncbi:MAG: hypothetical protein M3135_09140 [Actinomycetota bacterium]|nr:hypothetical protein [Actinomycetota bacterium]
MPTLKLPKLDLGAFLRGRALPWTVATIAVAAAVLFAVLWRAEAGRDDRAREVRAVGRAFLIALTNFSAETIDQDVEEIRAFAVGGFADEVEVTFSEERVEAIRSQAATSTGEIEALYVQDVGEDTATLFGVVHETVANETSTPREDALRIEVGLIETADSWKVEQVELLQTPAAPVTP